MGHGTPHISSRQCCNALARAGFEPARKASGTHQAWKKKTPGRTYVTIVVLNKREIAEGTLEDIVSKAGMTMEEFCQYLR